MSIDARGPARASASELGPRRTAGREDLVAFVERARRSIERNSEYLDRLDAALGDGDHGENMLIGCTAATAAVAAREHGDVGELLREIGHTLVASVGGASGPLYGTAFIEAGLAVEGAAGIDVGALADAFDAAARGLARRGRCSVGDKTIYDALEPAARSLRRSASSDVPLGRALARAASAARRGMRGTVPLIARRGLALRLGERSRGHLDPGAASCYLLVRALQERSEAPDLVDAHG